MTICFTGCVWGCVFHYHKKGNRGPMLEELKKRYQKYTLKKTVICVIIAIALLAVSKFGIFTIFKGPIELTGEWNPEELEGKYVTLEVDWVLATFAEETSTNTKTNVTTTTSVCYIGEYYHEPTNFGMFYGIKVSNGNREGLEEILNQVYDDAVNEVSGRQRITGTLEKMNGEMLQYYDEVIEEVFGAEYLGYAVPYAIMDEEVKGVDIVLVYLLSSFAAIALIVAVLGLLGMVTGKHDKYMKKFLESHPRVSMTGLEADFSHGKRIGKKIIAGRKYTFYQSGPCMKVVEQKDIIWAYYFSRSGRYSQSLVRTFNIRKEQVDINASKADAEELLQYYATNAPQMVVGYDKELEKCYKKEFEVFLSYRYKQAKEQWNAEEFMF